MFESLGGIDSRAMDLWVRRTAESGLSFEAIDTSDGNKRVGAYLCTVYEKGVPHAIDEELGAMDMDEKMQKVVDILDGMHLHLRPQIYERFNVNAYLEGVNLSVLPGYGGQGIAGKLSEAIENKAREMSFPLVYVCCSSEYTAKVVAKRNYQLIHTLPYDQHLEDGTQVFHTKPPHTAIKCYVRLVD